MNTPDGDPHEIPKGAPPETRLRPDEGQIEHPDRVGRYRIEKVLGQGDFSVVYLAHDEQLERPVALRVPHADLVSRPEDAASYLAEARKAARLDHPHIVPVHDVGSTDDFFCYVVSKYVEGSNLATKLRQSRLTYTAAAKLVAAIAEALHHAHTHGVIHQNLKPSSMLIGPNGTPMLVLGGTWLVRGQAHVSTSNSATPTMLHRSPYTLHPSISTLHYMSPEQARGEGHRVDGRSDVFSLGVVLYELLAGRRPFLGETQSELFEQLTSYEPRPLRQYDDRIPKELARICDKAIAKRVKDRYITAKELAEDLWCFMTEADANDDKTASETMETLAPDSTKTSESAPASVVTYSSVSSNFHSSFDSQPLKIVPKGLRSFDAHDADFFLELVPGPRDRYGLPDSIRFWKTRIEQTDAADTFPVGMVYGPSGCGKSSLVKAGLLPRLSEDVLVVYVEATAAETEARLLHGLRRSCSALDDNLNLQETLLALRRGQGIPIDKKVLIVLDQFEQWLHANTEEADTELVRGLRQCDGSRLQCIVIVRDDFWLAATRFMGELEFDLLQGQNSALVDLFDQDHARKVLTAFGRAFGQLPEQPRDTSEQQRDFLNQAVAGLAKDGKASCVRLALFAEMMKGKNWTLATLRDVGGVEGIGVTFLEESFSAQTAHPKHRLHQHAARAVLKSLLPELGSNIKGRMKSDEELLKASGYANQRQDFDVLIKLLDSELRLITPTEAVAGDGWSAEGEASLPTTLHPPPSTRFFQLTHDYLVPSLREWLTRKQRETRQGRAELRLAERASVWGRKPETRHLPSLWESLRIVLFTETGNWNKSQCEMMRRATRVHGLRWASALLIAFAAAGGFAYVLSEKTYETLLVNTNTFTNGLANSSGVLVPRAIKQLDPLPSEMVIAELRFRYNGAKQPALAYALAKYRDVDIDYLVDQIESAQSVEVDNLVTALGHARDASLKALQDAAARAEKQNNWSLKARLAVVALHLGDTRLAAEMCENGPDPIQRSRFIKECATWHGDLQKLAKVLVLPIIDDPSLRSGLCSGIGGVEFEKEQAWIDAFKVWFKTQRDAGTHSAAGWALRTRDEELPEVEESTKPRPGYAWHVSKTLGMTMLKIPKGTVTYESKEGKNIVKVRSFWLQDREVSVRQFERFVKDTTYPRKDRPLGWSRDTRFGHQLRGNDQPVSNAIFNDALLFCNWLSDKEKLQPCYHATDKHVRLFSILNPEQKAKYSHGRFKVFALDKNADGYRLPMELEWDYACRAGALTRFSFGNDEELLSDYAVYRAGRSQNGASKLPNAWGLFDMYGNVGEWCKSPEDRLVAHPDSILGSLRGGSSYTNFRTIEATPLTFREFMKNSDGWGPLFLTYGFRVARSVSP